MIVAVIYIALFLIALAIVFAIRKAFVHRHDFTSLKTVTFGDESAVSADRAASIISVVVIFLIWGAFTGSSLVPFHMPGPFYGQTEFTYTAETDDGAQDDGIVRVLVHEFGADVEDPELPADEGFALNDASTVASWQSTLIRAVRNDEGENPRVVAINGAPVELGETVQLENGEVTLTPRGSLNFTPATGFQMQPLYLPSPEAVVTRLFEIARDGFQNTSLPVHVGMSLYRVVFGFFLGALVGIPLGYAMGLSGWVRGWFDPIVEFMRPVPPLALIPLVIIWAGIGEVGKIVLLFLAALWIMAIGARAGVSGVNISKIHAAYSLGASKWQIMRHVIVPNSLPEIFTAARVAMGVCWGTVVAAELVAANEGAGMMIMVASRFQMTDIVIMGIILIGLIGYGIDILMRKAETWLVPWKGRS